ncbi:hypothetical protein NN561_002664 [Cricetulus griseus]
MTSWTNYGARTRARSLGQHRVPERPARARGGRCEAPRCRRRRRGREDRATVAAEGRRYGSHTGTNASGPVRARPPLRAGVSRGQLKGRTKRPYLRRHEPAPASQPRGTGSPASPVPSTVGLPHGSGHRHRRGKGTG